MSCLEQEVLSGEQQLRQRSAEMSSVEARLTSRREVLVVRKEALKEVGEGTPWPIDVISSYLFATL